MKQQAHNKTREHHPAKKSKKSKKAIVIKFVIMIVVLLSVILAFRVFGLGKFLNKEYVTQSIEAAGPYGPALFMAVYALATILFIPGTPLTIAGGAIFGPTYGTAYVIVGATVGAGIAFLFSRFFGEEFIAGYVEKKFKALKEWDNQIEENGFIVMLILRFVPIFPFNGLNFAMGLTKMKFRDYALGTFLGIIPGTFVYSFLGGSLANLNIWQIVLAIGLIVGLIVISMYFKKHVQKTKPQPKKGAPSSTN